MGWVRLKENTLILLLCGGDKSTHGRDIKKAKVFWQDYLGGK
jgi:putative component of toxin-antitoxin plasmid stabilization module